ncbi:MAG: hypothetical protein ACREPP_10070 [Rhodanobacteraceae bacterium]
MVMKKILLAVGFLLTAVIALVIGIRLGARSQFRQSAKELDSVQAMMAFNRISDERNMQHLLSKGCIDQAKQWVDFYYDVNMRILADKYRIGITPDVTDYINKRDPDILNSLSEFKSKFRSSWVQKACR